MNLRALAFSLLILGASGCIDGEPKSVARTTSEAPKPPLEGWVLDPAQSPVEGAMLRIEAANATATTGPDGRYAFGSLPTDEPLVVTAGSSGFESLSKGITLAPDSSMLLNFTLVPIPVKEPRVAVETLAGRLACRMAYVVVGEEEQVECTVSEDPNNAPILEFAMGPDVAGVVLELEWDAATPLAEMLRMTVETVGFGDQDQVLETAVGTSVLRAQINSFQAAKFYSGGGIARVIVEPGTNPDEEESTIGAALALQQGFQLHVSVFYVEGPLPTYTVFG